MTRYPCALQKLPLCLLVCVFLSPSWTLTRNGNGSMMALAFSTTNSSPQSKVAPKVTEKTKKILVLGDTGFLGQEIVKQLQFLKDSGSGVDFIVSSRTSGLDLTSPGAVDKVAELAQGCQAVISTVGSLLGTEEDEVINAANAVAAEGCHKAGCVRRFVAIGNDPKVREFSKSMPPLKSYAKGKETSENAIFKYFPDSYTIVQPTLMHGGDEFKLSPPRIPNDVGQVVEDVLALYPLQALSEFLPSVFGIALQAPMSRERVAKAAINAALGLAQGRLDSRDAIVLAASHRPAKELSFECSVDESAVELKQQLYDLGDCGGDPIKLETAFKILEKIENCNEGASPSTDPVLNGRWDFVFDVEADIGTGVVKDILLTPSSSKDTPKPLINLVFELEDLYMMIENNSDITINVQTRVLRMPMELLLTTKITPDPTDPSGSTFLETFSGASLAGRELKVPDSWQRSRPLEFSYLDGNMLIARGNGGEPHYLKR